jgi:acyl-[acyl-carrier-protein] desaturase
MTISDSSRLLLDLEPAVTENLDRHLRVAKEWMPHEYVPWSLGRDFADLGGEAWAPEQSALSPVARTALEVNLLTEDNLPSYHREIERAFGRDRAWGTWVHRWTAEEARHAYCIRDYLLVTRGVDPEELEQARMQVMQTGFDAEEKPIPNVLAYVSFHELATRVSHRNTGKVAGDPIAEKLLTRVSTDENLRAWCVSVDNSHLARRSPCVQTTTPSTTVTPCCRSSGTPSGSRSSWCTRSGRAARSLGP